jgi:predicted enzyme related to lactoylglutathione lyase
MKRALERGAALRLELVTDDLPASLDFYGRVLGFEKDHVLSEKWGPRN